MKFDLLRGFRMPAEFEAHDACLMVWPVRPGSWPNGAKAAREAFREVIACISESEHVYVLAGPDCIENARTALALLPNVSVLPIETDDAWARDIGPTFVINDRGERIGINWKFNAWGGEFDGLYAQWNRDDAAAQAFCEAIGSPCFDAHPFVLEGGSIHSDGEGTLLVTEACLLSKGRNPELAKEEIEETLCRTLGASKVLWLPHGIIFDETNEHVDNVAAFVKPGEIVLAWTDDESDPQYAYSKADLDYLEHETDAKGRKLIIHRLPIPASPILVTDEDLVGYDFEEGEDVREPGDRLAASYVNFYIANASIVMPAFGDPNDAVAAAILEKLFPGRKICPVPARDILAGGGNIHCITQQLPSVR